MSKVQQALVAQLPASIKIDAEPVFAEPWHAQAFAIVVALLQNRSFTLSEWAATLGEEVANAAAHGIVEDGSAYYELWLRALERLVAAKKLSDPQELLQLQQSWQAAYANTPHGQAVTLSPHPPVNHNRDQP